MRVGQLPRLPYYAPGDLDLGPLVETAAHRHHALLLSNHGAVAASDTLATADVEEVEETARPFFLLHQHRARVAGGMVRC